MYTKKNSRVKKKNYLDLYISELQNESKEIPLVESRLYFNAFTPVNNEFERIKKQIQYDLDLVVYLKSLGLSNNQIIDFCNKLCYIKNDNTNKKTYMKSKSH